MIVRIEVRLRPSRTEGGNLTVYDTLTGLQALIPIPCLGRASGGPPAIGINGNTPLGDYWVTGIMPAPSDIAGKAMFGIHPRLKLTGINGEAATREQVSPDQIRIHGGHLVAQAGILMATRGCIRVHDVDMQSLLRFLADNAVAYPFSLTVVESSSPPSIASGDDPVFAG